jgi:signal transduction histidine kinase/ligand-binding sensor domain-containing protein
MWIGTRHGLNQYNGHSFRVFKPSTGNSITNEFINSIAEESNGTIWVATMNGLNYYEPSRNYWHSVIPVIDRDGFGLPNTLIWDIAFGQDSLLWIASDVFAFCSYNTKTKKFTYYDWPGFARTLPSLTGSRYTSVQKFAFKSNHEIWLATTRGLVLLDIRTSRFTLLGAGYNTSVVGLYYDKATGKVFLSVDNGKCFVYNEKDGSYSELVPEPEPYPSTEFRILRNNELWLANSNGLLKISNEYENPSLSQHIPGFSGSLLPGSVKAVYKDDRGLRWIGTTNGIALHDPDRSATFLPLLSASDKASGNNMGGAYYDEISNSYFACSLIPAAVFMVPASGGKIQKFTKDSNGKPFSSCNNIRNDNENNLWLLTDRNVYRFNRTSQQFVLFPMPNRESDAGFRAFIQDGKGNYWFGTYLRGVYHYRLNEKKFDSVPSPFMSWTRKIGSLGWDPFRQSVWLSAYASNVLRYDLQSGNIEGYEDKPGLAALSMANDIIVDKKGNTWIATSTAGVIRFDPGPITGESFRQFDMRSGLPGNSFHSLCEDANSNIWLLSERGIDVIDSSGKIVRELNTRQSFGFSNYTSDSRSPHTIFFNKTKNELVSAVGGGLYLIPTMRSAPKRPFPVVVTNIRIGSRDTSEEHSTKPSLQKLPYYFNLLNFEFAGLNYAPDDGTTYEYKLSGYDQQWIPTTSYSAFYQNLPAGKYHFQVRARYPNGKIAGEASGFNFTISPPFWKTTGFIILIVLLVCALIGWFIYTLLQKLKAEKVLNSFATSLYGQNTIEDICWDTARNCVTKLGFTDCVIYRYEEERKLLLQKAAYGPKNPRQREIHNSIVIPLGKGIVGSVAASGKMEIVNDTSKDPRYIIDDEKRLSEISVPIFVDGKLFGIIDSEHPQRSFYTRYHARLLRKIASICAERIAWYQAEERLRGKIARDLHDEMGSTLTSINIMCKVAMEGEKAEPQVKDYLQKIKDNSSRMLESIGDMVWVINPANDNFEKLMFRMKEFAAEMLEPLKINYHFKEEGILYSVQLNLEQRKEIYMIFKEAVTNAVKYSGTSELFVTLAEKNGMLSMEIADSGIGFDPHSIMQGNGLKNMRARAAQIGAELYIEPGNSKGSRILFRLALT